MSTVHPGHPDAAANAASSGAGPAFPRAFHWGDPAIRSCDEAEESAHMKSLSRSTTALALGIVALTAACSSAAKSGSASPSPAEGPSSSVAAPAKRAPNAADVHFMSGMIPHHAQAVL